MYHRRGLGTQLKRVEEFGKRSNANICATEISRPADPETFGDDETEHKKIMRFFTRP
jgi:hypothetical protein